MAFENPFLQPSAVRQSALKYLFSDEPASESVMSSAGSSPSFVDTFTSPSNSFNTINAIAANVLANGGEYNADQGIDASKPVDPFATAIAFSKYGSAIKGAASIFGLGGFFNVAQQQNANDIITEMEKWGGEGADKSNVGLSILGAGLSFLNVPLAGFISGESKDAVAAVKGLASQFETPEAMKGYFTAADEQATLSRENFDGNGFLGSMAGNLAKEGDINDFGQKVFDLQSEIDKGISSGQDLGQVQASLLDKYITPDTKLSYAIPTAVSSPALPTPTDLGKLETPEVAPVVDYNPPEPIFDLGSTTPATSFQPANADGSFVNPEIDTPTSIIGDLFPEYPTGGMLTSPVVGGPISTTVPTPSPLPPAGGMFDTPEPAPVIEYNPPEPIFDTSSPTPTAAPTGGYVTDSRGNIVTSGDGTAVSWGTGAPSYTPTENERSFAATDGYTADVPSASAGGYDPTSGYDSDTDSGGGGSSGKIVCTAMNESYGFGSFRNRIWLAYAAKHLTKEHEKGYHALFLPLVDIAYRKQTIISKPLRAVLENIARHRSADLRAEMRGSKRDTIGRVYRAILEPLCYFVGKYK
jgi:hypothetical protein